MTSYRSMSSAVASYHAITTNSGAIFDALLTQSHVNLKDILAVEYGELGSIKRQLLQRRTGDDTHLSGDTASISAEIPAQWKALPGYRLEGILDLIHGYVIDGAMKTSVTEHTLACYLEAMHRLCQLGVVLIVSGSRC